MPVVEELIRALEEDERARKRLAKLLASEVASEADLRLVLINAVLRDVATKADLRELEARLTSRIDGLEKRVSQMDRRLSGVEGRLDLLVKVFPAFNVPLLVAVIGILLKMVFG